jgi:hypothetical protein
MAPTTEQDRAMSTAADEAGVDLSEYLSTHPCGKRVIGGWSVNRSSADSVIRDLRALAAPAVQAAPAPVAESTATPRQVDYLVDLYAAFTSRRAAEERRAHFASLTRSRASALIDEHKATAGR